MNRFLGWLDGLRRKAFGVLSGGKVISAVAHLFLVLAGCLIPALPFYWLFGFPFAVLAFFALSEVWFDFMLARDVLDYCKHKAEGHDIDHTWQDGLGDLAGPFAVRMAGWLGLLWLIFGGA